MNKLAELIKRSAVYYGNRTALVCNSERLSFRQVHEQSNAFGRALQALGVQKGDRVAVLLNNCTQYVIADFALIKGGFVRVPLNARLAPSEYEYILQDSTANTLIYGEEFAVTVNKMRSRLPYLRNFICVGNPANEGDYAFDELVKGHDRSDFATDVTGEDRFQILYTSGTTGKPKGAVTNYKSRLASLNNVFIDEINITTEDVMLHVASMAHGGGTKVLPHFVKGAVNVLMPKFSLENFCKLVEAEKVTTTWLVPTMIGMLLEYPDLPKYNLSSLRTVVYAAAPMPVATLQRAINTFGNIFVQVYGLSEAPNPDLVLTKEDHMKGLQGRTELLGSAGRTVLNVDVRVVDENGNDVKGDEIGEIIIRGDNIMTEYWNLPEATRETVIDGWLYTGDLARVDEEGYIYIVDRRKDMIISGGYNIYPREIEEVLYRHPAVLEAAVVGIPDPKWGESVKAFVALRDGYEATEQELIAFCQKHLASFKKPKVVEFLPELPKSSNGKILKRALRDQHWKGYQRMVN